MAKQAINNGTTAGDGTGEILFTAFKKTNENFNDLYDIGGYAYYDDSGTMPITVTTTPVRVTINKLGPRNYDAKLPLPIRGIGSLWSGTHFITPIAVGDAYDLRFDFMVNSKSSNPNRIVLTLDIGGDTNSITIPVVEITEGITKTPPYRETMTFPIFVRSDFFNNGGQLFMNTDTGSIEVGTRAIFLKRDYNGNL
jgi:hypothetical protein